MRTIRGLLVAVSAGAMTLGMAGASHALGDPVVDNSQHSLDHSCVGGTFGSCTQSASFAPELLGDVSLTGPSGLLGPNGLLGPSGLLGPIGQTTTTTGTTSTTSTTSTKGTTGTTGTPAR
ncbi:MULTISPECIES: hypothetical protein [Streptomyces]|uniref:Chaplin domain-containing protein n=1 Tax=Streptomyces viridochromogenes TaxID=1938 RepID=A0A0L8LC85_STRVR|nr:MULTISPECIES: hypothetical protein [Streptomyces]KOG35853.1 hypothetical protein ADK34_04090 [Streptomyces viridochromogenes]